MARGERPEVIPLAEVRSSILATQPGAAALAFERLQSVVIEFILGWNIKKQQPHQWIVREQKEPDDAGGVLGICRAFAIANETQARGSLHMHILLWSHGHDNIAQRIRCRAAAGDTQRACAELTRLLEGSYTSELQLPVSLVEQLHRCPRPHCKGELHAAPDAMISALRRPLAPTGACALKCAACKHGVSCQQHIASAVDNALAACGTDLNVGKSDSTSQRKRAQFKWNIQRRGAWPIDKHGLQVGAMQSLSNTHRAEHTHTCWKKKQSDNRRGCRFRFPQIAIPDSEVKFSMLAARSFSASP